MADAVKSGHGRKFSLAYLGLAAVLGAAVGTFILLVEKPAPKPPPPWSAWRPTSDTSLGRATEIAEHVAKQYHLASGDQLVRVIVGGPAVVNQGIRLVAVAKSAEARTTQDFNFFDPNRSVMYILCGTGEKCAIKEGKASIARGAVLRRQALELALYTFEYVEGTESVVAFFPPRKGEDPSSALFFHRSDFDEQLDKPLRQTLPQAKPPVPGRLTNGERRIVDALTGTRIFRYAVDEANGQRILVLAPRPLS